MTKNGSILNYLWLCDSSGHSGSSLVMKSMTSMRRVTASTPNLLRTRHTDAVIPMPSRTFSTSPTKQEIARACVTYTRFFTFMHDLKRSLSLSGSANLRWFLFFLSATRSLSPPFLIHFLRVIHTLSTYRIPPIYSILIDSFPPSTVTLSYFISKLLKVAGRG